MTTIRRALVFSLGERYILIALGLVGNIALARLLTPEEIGLYSVSLALVGIAHVLRDFGIGSYLIQKKELLEEHIRTAFGFALAIGLFLFVVVMAIAPLAAEFYKDPRLVLTIRITAFNFLVIPFCTVSNSLLRRDMMFDRVATISLVSSVVGFIATMGFAYTGFGANSMAYAALASNITTGVGAWVARPERKLLWPSFSDWRGLLGFGSGVSATNLVTTISMDINDLAVGKILGFTDVAMISRGQGMMNMFSRDLMGAIRGVALSGFAKSNREGDDLEVRYLQTVANVTVIAWPFHGFCAIFALELIRLLFGLQWDQAAGLAVWFSVAGALAATCNLVGSLLTARGRIDLVVRQEMVLQPLRAVLLVLGIYYFRDITAFAVLYAAVALFSMFYIYYIKEKCQPTNWVVMWKNLWSSTWVTLVTLIPAVAVALIAPPLVGNWMIFSVVGGTGLLCAVAWTLAIIKLKHPLAEDALFLRATAWLRRSAPVAH